MENIESLTKWEKLKRNLKEKEIYEKELLINFQNEWVRLRDEYRAWNITYEDYKNNEHIYNKLIKDSEAKYKKFLSDLHNK